MIYSNIGVEKCALRMILITYSSPWSLIFMYLPHNFSNWCQAANKTEKTFQSYAAGKTVSYSLHEIIKDKKHIRNNWHDWRDWRDWHELQGKTRKIEKMKKFYMFDFKDIRKKAVPTAAADFVRQLKIKNK